MSCAISISYSNSFYSIGVELLKVQLLKKIKFYAYGLISDKNLTPFFCHMKLPIYQISAKSHNYAVLNLYGKNDLKIVTSRPSGGANDATLYWGNFT